MNTPQTTGFTDDDEAARNLSLRGRPLARAPEYADLILAVREKYRQGGATCLIVITGGSSEKRRTTVEQCLAEAFPTSIITCTPGSGLLRDDLRIAVIFPQKV